MAETHERLIGRLAAVLASLHAVEPGATRLCEAGRRMLDADGVALSLMTSADAVVVVAVSDAMADRLEDLQEVVGEGPSRDAYLTNSVQIAEFTEEGDARWPLMHQHGRRLGFEGTMTAAPLRPHDEVIGTLTAHWRSHQPSVDTTLAEFLGVAIGAALLQDPNVGKRGEVHGEVWSARSQIHQATGMIISQVGVRPEDALALLRGQAFAQNTTLLDIAQQIVDRRINFRHFMIEGD